MLIFRESKERLNENSFDRKVNSYIKDYTGLEDFNQVRSFLLNKVYKTIPELRLITQPEAVQSALEWFFNPDGSQKNEDYIAPFRQILQAIKEKNPGELNKMGYAMRFMEPQSYCREYGYLLKHEKNTVPSSKTQKERTTPNGYHIRRIDSFNEAYEGGMSEWCIGREDEYWDEMVGYTATVYLVWNKDVDMDYEETHGTFTDENGDEFETTYDEYFMDMSYNDALRDPNYGSFGSGKYPYDRYGLSKLVVIAHENGMFEVWSRYNLTDGKDGTFLTEKQLTKLIGMNARQAFPYVDFNIKEVKNNKTTMKAIRLTESQLRRYIREAVESLSGRRGSLTEERGNANIMRDYRRIMPFAVDEIFSGNVGKSPVDLINGYVITRISPESTGRWGVYKRNYEGYMITTSISDQYIRIHVRKPNTSWLEGEYYLVYKDSWDDDDYQY